MRAEALLLAALLAACNVFPGTGARRPSAAPAPPDRSWLEEVDRPQDLERLPPEREGIVVRALADLVSTDFETYSGAARSLADMGEPVLPYLGHAARPGNETLRRGIVCRIVLRRVPASRLRIHLESGYPLVRAAAAELVGERHLTEHAGRLVALLDDPEADVRHKSAVALRVLSNHFFGYRAEAPPREREEAAARWREMWGSG